MLVVVMEAAGKQHVVAADLRLPPEVALVDPRPALLAALPSADRESYLRAYAHWRGTPPRLVDEHPNARAHAIVAAQVLAALGSAP